MRSIFYINKQLPEVHININTPLHKVHIYNKKTQKYNFKHDQS